MIATQVRRIPLVLSVLVVLIITVLLCLALLLSSGALHLAGSGGSDPNGVTNGSMINPDGLTCSGMIDPNGGSCQHHANGLLAAGSGMDGNGHS